jgi:hypothetical protein
MKPIYLGWSTTLACLKLDYRKKRRRIVLMHNHNNHYVNETNISGLARRSSRIRQFLT